MAEKEKSVKDEQLTERESLEEERAALNRERMEMEAAKLLNAAGIPESFAPRIYGADLDETKANIDVFAEEWNSAVTAAINEKLKGKTPGSGVAGSADSIKAMIRRNIRG